MKNKIRIKGVGEKCNKCGLNMERREHLTRPKTDFFYSEWDYCPRCKFVKHYEKFKSLVWLEIEQNQSFLNCL